jgi:hypothetical protein
MTIRSWSRRRSASVFAAASLLAGLSSAAHAQQPTPLAARPFDTGIVVGGDWLQANALPLDRDAMQSASFDISLRRGAWAVNAGFLRVARTLSTVQGAYVSAGPLLHWRRVLFLPTVGALAGKSYASADSTGYDWVGAGGVTGHEPRFSYSTAGAFGGGIGLTVEVPVYRMIAVRALASQWYFSGAPLENDRARTVVGAGLSLRFDR